MKKKFYLPNQEAARAAWLNNFINKLAGGYAATFGLGLADMGLLKSFLLYYVALIAQLENARKNVKDLTKYKDDFCNSPRGSALVAFSPSTVSLPPLPTEGGMWADVRFWVNSIKKNANYTESIGIDLGVIGSDTTFDPTTFKPVMNSVKVQPGPHIIIDFGKDLTDGCNFYCRTNGGAWEKRAYDTNPPYDDYTPLAVAGTAEKREYRCRAVINDDEIGVYSDIETLTVSE
jgi:hypothetical protein